VIKASTGKLLGNAGFTEEQLLELKKIHSAATKLSQAQKSLLLLSKIGNNEFGDNSNVEFADIVKSSLSFFEETIGLRQIKLKKEIADCTVFMDAGLAGILVNNLIKNAVKHNVQSGFISVKLTNKELTIENSGADFKGNTDTLLQRFGKGENGNIGIGLAIVKEICELYDFKLQYTVTQGKHIISILFTQK
jgi:signal transduction histidine kinase